MGIYCICNIYFSQDPNHTKPQHRLFYIGKQFIHNCELAVSVYSVFYYEVTKHENLKKNSNKAAR